MAAKQAAIQRRWVGMRGEDQGWFDGAFNARENGSQILAWFSKNAREIFTFFGLNSLTLRPENSPPLLERKSPADVRGAYDPPKLIVDLMRVGDEQRRPHRESPAPRATTGSKAPESAQHC